MSDMSCYNGPELRTINEIPRKAKMGFDRPQKKAIGSLRVRSSRSDVKDGMIRWLRNLNHQKKLVDLSPKSPTYFFFSIRKIGGAFRNHPQS